MSMPPKVDNLRKWIDLLFPTVLIPVGLFVWYALSAMRDKTLAAEFDKYVAKERYERDWAEHRKWSDERLERIDRQFAKIDQVLERQTAFRSEIKEDIHKLSERIIEAIGQQKPRADADFESSSIASTNSVDTPLKP